MAQSAQVESDIHVHVELLHGNLTREKADIYEDEVFKDGAKNGPGYVYLLSERTRRNGGQPTNYYKIGVSSKPDKRLADLQTGNPRPLVFQGEPTCVSRVISAERAVHKAVELYASSLGGGQEWFHVPERDWEKFWNSYQKELSEYTKGSCTGM